MNESTDRRRPEDVIQRILRSGELDGVLAAHRQWLSRFDLGHRRNWDRLFAANPEAAATEAEVRELFERAGAGVTPGESLTGATRRPDFLCVDHRGRPFAVEVRNLGVAAVTRHTGMEPSPTSESGAFSFAHMNRLVFDACVAKHGQAVSAGVPVVVAVGTYHFQASSVCLHPRFVEQLLTGDELITVPIDTSTGGPAGPVGLSTRLWNAAFLRPRPHDPGNTMPTGPTTGREHISALLLLGLGARPAVLRGALHPAPQHPFDPSVLPDVGFCRLKTDATNGTLATEWIGAPVRGRS